MNMEECMKVGDRVKWLGAKPGSWTGDGSGEVVAITDARRGFGGDNGEPGPAAEIKLDGPKGLTVWVGPDDLLSEF
jgi:hypothetical protein